MTDQEADAIFAQLAEMLRAEHLEWIVESVVATLDQPRIQTVLVDLDDAKALGSTKRRKGRVVRHQSRDWNSSERLAILLDAIDSAICVPVPIETQLLELVPELNGREIEFLPDRSRRVESVVPGEADHIDTQRAYSIRFDKQRVVEAEHRIRLGKSLQELRAQLDVDLD